MAVDTALLTRQRTLAAKIETTTGTAIALAAADGAINVFGSSLESAIKMVEREPQGTFTPLAPIPGASEATSKFKTEMTVQGGVSDPFWMTVLLKACGFAVNATIWKPLTGAGTTLTMGLYQSGQLLQMAGAVGKFTMNFESGKPVMIDWDFQGVWQSPTGVALITPTYPAATLVPRFAGATLTLGGLALRVGKMSITVENSIAMREDATALDPGGYGTGIHSYQITGRKITTKISPEALPLATKDWWADHRAVTGAALAMVIGGSTAFNNIHIGAPALVHLDAPGVEDDNGIYRNSLNFLNLGSMGDDELTIQQPAV